MSEQTPDKHDHVLAQLVVNLQMLTMQHLGKLQNPADGQVARNLEQARATIDILEMLKVKCRADTPDEIVRMLDQIVMDLQLNYMDELKQDGSADVADPPAEADAGDEGCDD